MAQEKKRGCGYRKVGGLYLMGTGYSVPCDMLPLKLKSCPTCGFEIPFYRGFQWIKKAWIIHFSEEHHNARAMKAERCSHTYEKVPTKCPLCFPEENSLEKYGLMWVGSRYYTPESFALEANKVGVCKKIPRIPKGLEIGKTWVLVAHTKVPFSDVFDERGIRKKEPEYHPAVFYAFKPTAIEMPIWKSKATKRRLNRLKKLGITPIIIDDGDKDHTPKKRKKRRRLI